MSNAIRRGEDDELERASEKERAKEKGTTEEQADGGLGLSQVPHQLTEGPRQRERESVWGRERERFVSAL